MAAGFEAAALGEAQGDSHHSEVHGVLGAWRPGPVRLLPAAVGQVGSASDDVLATDTDLRNMLNRNCAGNARRWGKWDLLEITYWQLTRIYGIC